MVAVLPFRLLSSRLLLRSNTAAVRGAFGRQAGPTVATAALTYPLVLAPTVALARPVLAHGMQGRAASSAAADETIMVRADTQVAPLGGAIAARVRRLGRVTVRSIGAKAAYRGLKAFINAAEYLQEDTGASPDEPLALRLYEQTESASSSKFTDAASPPREEDEARRTVLHFQAERLRLPKSAAAQQLIVGSQTNAGKAAAAVASSLRAEGGSADVRAMGAVAVHQALIATCLAQKYLDSDGKGVKLVVRPRFETFAAEAGAEDASARGAGAARGKRQLVLGIQRGGT